MKSTLNTSLLKRQLCSKHGCGHFGDLWDDTRITNDSGLSDAHLIRVGASDYKFGRGVEKGRRLVGT